MEGTRGTCAVPVSSSDGGPVLTGPPGTYGAYPTSTFGTSSDGSKTSFSDGSGFPAGLPPDMIALSSFGGPPLTSQVRPNGPATIGTPTPPLGSVLTPRPPLGVGSCGSSGVIGWNDGLSVGNTGDGATPTVVSPETFPSGGDDTSPTHGAMSGVNPRPDVSGFPVGLPVSNDNGIGEHRVPNFRPYLPKHQTAWIRPANAMPVSGSFGPGLPSMQRPPSGPQFDMMQQPHGVWPQPPPFPPFCQYVPPVSHQASLGNHNVNAVKQAVVAGGQEQFIGNLTGQRQPPIVQTDFVNNTQAADVGAAIPHQGTNLMFNRPPVPFLPPFSFPNPLQPAMAQVKVWSEHKHPDGRTSFFNHLTGQSVWERPNDLDAVAPAFLSPGTPLPSTPGMSGTCSKPEDSQNSRNDEQLSKTESDVKELAEGKNGENISQDKSDEKGEEDGKPNEQTEDESADSKPVSTKPIPGHAPWIIVFTNDKRVFFFNQRSQESVWTIPEELAAVTDLKELMKIPQNCGKAGEAQQQEQEKEMECETATTLNVVDAEPPAKRHPGMSEDLSVTGETSAVAPAKQATKEDLTLEERQHLFRQMLIERQVSAFSTWEKELHKIVFDPRYLLLNVKERRHAFENFLRTRVEGERLEKKARLQEAKQEFSALLEESVTVKTTFNEFAMKNSRDRRFKVIEKAREREKMFNDFVAVLRTQQKQRHHLHREKNIKRFLEMLSENTDLTSESCWSKVKRQFQSDSRYRGVHHSHEREDLFHQYIVSLTENVTKEERQKRERQERAEASLRERARQVEKERSEVAQDLMMERVVHFREEAVQHFTTMLADLVKVSDVDWAPARAILKKDPRWQLADMLESEEKQRLFDEHVGELNQRKRAVFRSLMDDIPGLTLRSTWKDVKRHMRNDPRFEPFCGSSDVKRKEAFANYMQERVLCAKSDYISLLRETRQITHKSKAMCNVSDHHRKEIIDIIKNDRRYFVLDCLAEERDVLFDNYLKELALRGPPPPPTANEMTDRLTMLRREQEGRL